MDANSAKAATAAAKDRLMGATGLTGVWADAQVKISEAAMAGSAHVELRADERLTADLIVERLVADGYYAHACGVAVLDMQEHDYIGHAMCRAQYVVHISWGDKAFCLICDKTLDKENQC